MLRVAFIGAGQRAHQHLQVVQSLPSRLTVVGVHDSARERAAALADLASTKPYDSIDRLLDEARPDVVHVCTPTDDRVGPTRAALVGGAHTYVEQPFACRVSDARTLLELADSRRLMVCAGHQLLRNPGFERLMTRVASLGEVLQIDSDLAFEPARRSVHGSSTPALARELTDMLAHPLYALVAVMERLGEPGHKITVEWVHAEPTGLQATLRSGARIGRLSVSLRARPVASTLTLVGTRGALTCDFMRSAVAGTANPGTEPLEQAFNPVLEGLQLASRATRRLFGRLHSTCVHPGLAESINAFHDAVRSGGPAPLSPAHLLQVTEIFESLAARIDAVTHPCRSARRASVPVQSPLTVVTGARGFLGAEVSKRLPRVRGIGRSGWPDWLYVHEWIRADLSEGVRPEALSDAGVVIHLAAETAGGTAEHQRNTIAATEHLLHAMHAAKATRLVLVSSLSVLGVPGNPHETQDETTAISSHPAALGPHAWGKAQQEALVRRQAAALGIATRVIRPATLIDWRDLHLPSSAGRRLFGRWHVGFGRPRLPLAVCEVGRCADVIAWTAQHFDEAPTVLNLVEPSMPTRGSVIDQLRARGWNGRVCWVPISIAAAAAASVGALSRLMRGLPRDVLDVHALLQPARIDSRLSAVALTRCDEDGRHDTGLPRVSARCP
jgi:predicted dehydrogenase/nucleoside-diphosphate-sugar epimerase